MSHVGITPASCLCEGVSIAAIIYISKGVEESNSPDMHKSG